MAEITTDKLIKNLTKLLKSQDLDDIKSKVSKMNADVSKEKTSLSTEDGLYQINPQALEKDLTQILDTQTLERTHYYIERLLKGLRQVKHNKVNQINYNRWRDYEHLITDSLWLMDRRDSSGGHSAAYHGNFIPQIPQQFLER